MRPTADTASAVVMTGRSNVLQSNPDVENWKGYLHLVRPIVLAAVVACLLSYSVDRTQPWSLVAFALGMCLLIAVFAKQVAEIMALRFRVQALIGEVDAGRGQLATVAEIIEMINRGPQFGGILGSALEKLIVSLQSEAGSIWLPAPDDAAELRHVEGRGWPDAEFSTSLLIQARQAIQQKNSSLVQFTLKLPEPAGATRHAVACELIDGKDSLGCLLVARASEPFRGYEEGVVAAVAANLGAGIRSIRALGEARRMADLDPVTGVFNHRSGHQRLQTAIRKASVDKSPVAVLMMDIDNFKLFNDTYGHPAGDDVLKRVADVLRRSCRDEDIVARYGGDEFIMVLPGASLAAAMRCAERIRSALSREHFRCETSESLPIGFSYGISVYPEDGAEPRELVIIADRHLYDSKAQGGGQITARGQRVRPDQLQGQSGFDVFWPMVVAVDNKDGYTRRHSEEVTAYCLEIGRSLELEEEMLETIKVSAMLHDVGKIAVPDAILRKPGRLTDEEFEVMKQHPELGAMIVGAFPNMDQVVLGVRHHHERYDGQGYPDGLAGEGIPLIGRIMAVADTFSAMTTNRPYRRGFTRDRALAEISRGLGQQFDPEIGALFVKIRREEAVEPPVGRRTRSNGKRSSKAAPVGEVAGKTG